MNIENDIVPNSKSLLLNKDFTVMFLGGFISDIGNFFTFIAILFLAIEETSDLPVEKSAQLVAIITLLRLIPSLLVGSFAGVLVDSFNRKTIMIYSDIFGAITSFGLVYYHSLYFIYFFTLLSSFSSIFFYPARGASIPKVVEPDQLVRANGLIQTVLQVSTLVGPAIAGFVIKFYDFRIAFIVDSISFVVSALFLITISTDLNPVKDKDTDVTLVQIIKDLEEGFELIKDDRVIAFVMIMFFILLIGVSMINPLLAFYLENSFGLDSGDFGLLLSVSALSGLIAALVMTLKGEIKHKLTLIIFGIFIMSITIAILGFAPSLEHPVLWLYIGMVVLGMINVTLNIPMSALFQAIVENKHLGKVSGFMGMLLSLAQTSGAFVATLLVIYFPIDQMLKLLSLFILIVVIISFIIMSKLRLEDEAQYRERSAIAKRIQKQAQLATLQRSNTVLQD